MASQQYRSRDLKRADRDPFDLVDHLGIAIRFMGASTQVHVGLLYKADNAATRLCHLRAHFDLCDEEPDREFRWLQVKLDPILRRLVVAACQIVVARRDRIPFGFTFEGNYFVPTTGELIRHPVGYGLTCATFILAVFRMMEIELIDTATWISRAEDVLWQDAMVDEIKKKYALVGAAVAEHVGDPRFRPEEVAAGGHLEPKPCKFADVEPIAKKVLADLGR